MWVCCSTNASKFHITPVFDGVQEQYPNLMFMTFWMMPQIAQMEHLCACADVTINRLWKRQEGEAERNVERWCGYLFTVLNYFHYSCWWLQSSTPKPRDLSHRLTVCCLHRQIPSKIWDLANDCIETLSMGVKPQLAQYQCCYKHKKYTAHKYCSKLSIFQEIF